jgi:hypothetical protein
MWNALLPLYSNLNFLKIWATLSPFHRLFSDVTLFNSTLLSWGRLVPASNHRAWEKWSVCHKSPCSFHLVLELCTLGCVSHSTGHPIALLENLHGCAGWQLWLFLCHQMCDWVLFCSQDQSCCQLSSSHGISIPEEQKQSQLSENHRKGLLCYTSEFVVTYCKQ